MRKMTHPFFHGASILVSVGVFLTHRFETVGVFAHFLCVKNAKTPSIWSSLLYYFSSRHIPNKQVLIRETDYSCTYGHLKFNAKGLE